LVDGVRDLRIADVGLVGAVEEDDGLVGLRVGDPGGELFAGGDGAGRVVGETKVNQIARRRGDGGNVAVGRRALEVDNTFVAAVEIGSGAAGHDVRVDVNRVDRIGNGEPETFGGEDFLDVAAIALRAVGNEDLVGGDRAAAGRV